MSRHRTAVTELANTMANAVASAINDDVAHDLVDGGIRSERIRLFGPQSPINPHLQRLKNSVEALVREAHLEDFRSAEVLLEFTVRERIGRCVAASAVTTRRFSLVDVRVTAAIETRWVHPRPEITFARQWVLV
jgi:hypothetical protein